MTAELTEWKVVLIWSIASILIVLTVGGNLLVIISFKLERRLQTVSNYFLLSLAVADLLIGELYQGTTQNFIQPRSVVQSVECLPMDGKTLACPG